MFTYSSVTCRAEANTVDQKGEQSKKICEAKLGDNREYPQIPKVDKKTKRRLFKIECLNQEKQCDRKAQPHGTQNFCNPKA